MGQAAGAPVTYLGRLLLTAGAMPDPDVAGVGAVFVGEVDRGKVVGFHNWLAFQAQEAAGRLNYLGHLLPRGRCAFPSTQQKDASGHERLSAAARVACSCKLVKVRSKLASGWRLPQYPQGPDTRAPPSLRRAAPCAS